MCKVCNKTKKTGDSFIPVACVAKKLLHCNGFGVRCLGNYDILMATAMREMIITKMLTQRVKNGANGLMFPNVVLWHEYYIVASALYKCC